MVDRPNRDQLLQQLRSTSFFEDLDRQTLDYLARNAHWRTYVADEIVFLEGETAPGLYYLQYGWLKVVKSSPTGREQVLRFLEPGEVFNEIGVFANQPNPATAIALEEAGVWLLRRESVARLLRERPDFAQQAVEKMAQRVLHLVDLVADLSLRTVTGRLARLLLEDADDDVLHRPRWYTQTELAARLGTVPDVIQRALRSLAEEDLIQVERRQIRILDRRRLEAKASFDN